MLDSGHRRQWRIATLLALLVLALIVVLRDEDEAHQFTPLDHGAVADLDVAYGGAARNTLDVYLPDTSGPHPVIVWIHGGGWVAGDKSRSMPVWDWTLRGYAVVSLNYRYAVGHATILDSVDDVINATDFVIEHADRWDLDPGRVGVYGFSAGGHLAAMVAHHDQRVAAVAIAASPTDFRSLVDPDESVFEVRPAAESAQIVRSRLGCAESSCEEAVEQASPALLSAGTAPMLILHGSLDRIVDPAQAVALAGHLEAEGATVELIIVDEAGHAPLEEHGVGAFFDSLLLIP